MVNSIEKILIIIFSPVFFIHEIWHYIPAKLLGVKSELHLTYIDFETEIPEWQDRIILLTPSVFGFTIWLVWTGFAYYRGSYLMILDALFVNIVWQLGCLGDYRLLLSRNGGV